MARITYKTLAVKKFKEQRNIVISQAIDRNTDETVGYSIAEQLIANENGKKKLIFLRGGLGIISAMGLLDLKEAVDTACEKIGLLDAEKISEDFEKTVDKQNNE